MQTHPRKDSLFTPNVGISKIKFTFREKNIINLLGESKFKLVDMELETKNYNYSISNADISLSLYVGIQTTIIDPNAGRRPYYFSNDNNTGTRKGGGNNGQYKNLKAKNSAQAEYEKAQAEYNRLKSKIHKSKKKKKIYQN